MTTKEFAKEIRKIIIDQSKRANVGHIGSALSIADIIAVLYNRTLNISSPENPDRDRFVLSKGHAALAVYAALNLKKILPDALLNTFCSDNSLLGVHPEHKLYGIDFTTGSLGHGLSIAAGAALAAKMKKSSRRIFVLLSDAECNEGSVWEAIMFSSHHKLSNLTAIVDLNGQQAFGYTKDVLDLTPQSKRWESFGWNCREINGHDTEEIEKTMESLKKETLKPSVIIAKTTFGKGVSYMQNKIKWHYWPMSEDEYILAKKEIEAGK